MLKKLLEAEITPSTQPSSIKEDIKYLKNRLKENEANSTISDKKKAIKEKALRSLLDCLEKMRP